MARDVDAKNKENDDKEEGQLRGEEEEDDEGNTTSLSSSTRALSELQRLLVNFLVDKDPLVRRTCLKCLVQLYSQGRMVDVAHYSRFTAMLKDDNELVREEAIHLIW